MRTEWRWPLHKEVLAWLDGVRRTLRHCSYVAELGSHDWNGSARTLFQRHAALYVGVDLIDGPGVDKVADAATWGAAGAFDLVICTEVLEHTAAGDAICHNAHRLLRPWGVLLLTCAAPGRMPHGATGDPLRVDEYYYGVSEDQLREWLRPFPVALVQARLDQDLYALAVKGPA